MITSLEEEAEDVSWFEQRITAEKDKDAKAIIDRKCSAGRIETFGMDLEFLLRKKPDWQTNLQAFLFTREIMGPG